VESEGSQAAAALGGPQPVPQESPAQVPMQTRRTAAANALGQAVPAPSEYGHGRSPQQELYAGLQGQRGTP
jgi:hypothetical protein